MDAYKQGIIDKEGNVIKKSYQLKNQKERQAYTYLDRLVVILKKAIKQNEKRGDFTLTRALSPALWVVREQLEAGSKATVDVETKYMKLYELDICLAEEEIIVEQFLKEEDGGAPAAAMTSSPTNNTMGVAGLRADDGPVVHQKDIKKFRTMARRSMPKLKELKP
jgi:hypothetical protein